MATAKASVVTASSSPETRRAGMPSTSAISPPATAQATRATNMSMPQLASALAMTTPPTPIRPTWPRLTTPPQPVSTTSDRAVRANVSPMVAVLTCDGDPTIGMATSAATTTRATAMRPARTSGRRASCWGSRRDPPTIDHEPSPLCRARPSGRCWTSSPMTTTTSMTRVVGSPRSTFQSTSCLSTPRPTPAAKAAGSDDMPLSTAAARPGKRMVGPAAASSARPSLGARSTTVRAASPPVSAHSSRDSWVTGMPSSRARSMFSAMPRTAVPASVLRRNHTSAPNTAGTTATSSRSFPLNVEEATVISCEVRAVSNPVTRASTPSQPGMKRAAPPSTWARPMVATVRTSRGAVWNRRITSRSLAAPTATPTSTPATAATGHDQPFPTARPAATPPPTPPMAP